jgi:hypothetical protein
MMKRIKDVINIKGDFIRLKSADGTSMLINKFQALHHAIELSMELYVEEADGIPTAELRKPRKVNAKPKKA